MTGPNEYLFKPPTSDPMIACAFWNDKGTLRISAATPKEFFEKPEGGWPVLDDED